MSQKTTPCDIDRLRKLLAGQLADADECAATQHVAECSACQQQLESLAGEPGWWRQMQAGLRSSAVNLLNQSAVESKAASSAGLVPHPADDSFIADFAVAFLEPCERPGTLGRLEDIEILEAIGHGGMGIVLKGFQRELGRYVAVKVLAPHLAASGAARTRFAREARAAAAVVHPHVMAIHAVHSSGRLPLLVMPYLACESLQQRLDRTGPLELNEILRIGHQIADGLAAAHAQGLVHRDVKPANILLERGIDRVLLTDFGLARAADDASLTRTGIIAGTPQYMSPEQARGDGVDARSDLFSLGSVLYAMAAGRPPFRAETSYGILRRITDSEPHSLRELNPNIPVWLEGIVRRLHAKAADDRYESAAEVATLLAQCLAHVQQPVAVPLPSECRVEVFHNPVRSAAMDAPRSWFKSWITRSIAAAAILGAAIAIGEKYLHRPPSYVVKVPGDSSRFVRQPQPATSDKTMKSSGTASRNTTSVAEQRPWDPRAGTPGAQELTQRREAQIPIAADLGLGGASKSAFDPRDQRFGRESFFKPGKQRNKVQGRLYGGAKPDLPYDGLGSKPAKLPERTEDFPAKTIATDYGGFPQALPKTSKQVVELDGDCHPRSNLPVPGWDSVDRDLNRMSEHLAALEKQDWTPAKFPAVLRQQSVTTR